MASQLERFFRAGDLEAARRAAEERLAEDPNSYNGWIARARVMMLDGDLAGGLEALEQILARRPDHAAAKTFRAVALDLIGRRRAAATLLRSAVKRAPRFALARYNLARQHLIAGQHDQALEQLEKAAELEPENPVFTFRIAELLLRSGRFRDAGEVLTALLSTYPTFSDAWLLAARAYLHLGDHPAAVRTLARGLRQCPSDLAIGLALFQVALASDALDTCAALIECLVQLDARLARVLRGALAVASQPDAEAMEQRARALQPHRTAEIAAFLRSTAELAVAAAAPRLKLAAEVTAKRGMA